MAHPFAKEEVGVRVQIGIELGVGAAVKAIISLIVGVHRHFNFWQSFATFLIDH